MIESFKLPSKLPPRRKYYPETTTQAQGLSSILPDTILRSSQKLDRGDVTLLEQDNCDVIGIQDPEVVLELNTSPSNAGFTPNILS